MAITIHDGGGFTIDGAHIELFRLLTMRSGLNLEIKTGMKLSRGRTCYALAKDLGFRGSREKVLAQLEAYIGERFQTEDSAE